MLKRALFAAFLRRQVFHEIIEDQHAILHALGMVLVSGIALGIGLIGVVEQFLEPLELGAVWDQILGMWMSVAVMVLGWLLWSFLVHMAGGKFLKGKASFREVMRVLGLCYGPAMLLALGEIPGVGYYLRVLSGFWVLVVAVVAIHEIEGIGWFDSVLSTLLGWFIVIVFFPGIVLIPYIS